MAFLYYELALLLSLVLLCIKILFKNNKKLPPTPFGLPIIGHLHLVKKPFHVSFNSLMSRYGPLLFLKFGCRQVLVVSSPPIIEECLNKNDIIFANRPKIMAAEHFTYENASFVWAPYGHLWRSLRLMATLKIFSSKSLQKTSYIQEEEVLSLARNLFARSINRQPQKVDLKFFFTLLTCNVVMRVATGKRCIEEGLDSNTQTQLLKEFKDLFFPTLTMNICDFIPFLRLIGFQGMERSMKKLQSLRDGYCEKLVAEAKLRRASSSSKESKSVVESILSLQETDPEFYTKDVIKSILLTMFVAGTETSTLTLEWAMSLLLNHPDEIQKLQAEIDSQVGNNRLINDTDLVNLPYLRCIINETLRLYPPAPVLIPHCSSETCTIQGFEVPKDTILMVNVWAMHRDPNVWEDPDKFKPGRFMGCSEAGTRDGAKYIPFGMGRRACPGANMGIRIVSLALGTLVQCFDWDKIGVEVDMSSITELSLSKAKPLQALCGLRPNMAKFLSTL